MGYNQYYGAFLPNVQWARDFGETPGDGVLIAEGTGATGPEDWYVYGYPGFGNADSVTLYLSNAPSSATGWSLLTTVTNQTGSFTYTPTVIGQYKANVVWLWTDESRSWTYNEFFDVVDPSGAQSGTDGAGRIIAIKSFEPPGVVHVVYETINGDLVAKQNPQ